MYYVLTIMKGQLTADELKECVLLAVECLVARGKTAANVVRVKTCVNSKTMVVVRLR